MAETITWTVEGLDELAEKLDKVRRAAPDLLLKQINRAGNDFRRQCIEETEKKVVTRKGNLVKGYKKSVLLERRNGSFDYEAQITGGNRKARHFHLIENGHRQTAEVFYKTMSGPMRPNQSRKVFYRSREGYTKGYKMVDTVRSRWNNYGLIAVYARMAFEEALKKGAIE